MIKIPIYVSYGGNPKPKGFTSNKQVLSTSLN